MNNTFVKASSVVCALLGLLTGCRTEYPLFPPHTHPLHKAAFLGDLPMVQRYLDRGVAANNAMNDAGVTPLMMAAAGGHTDIARLLLDKWATVNDHQDVVKFLRSRGIRK